MKKYFNRDTYLAASIAASWAWGFSLLTGLTVSQERGIIPFIIWGVANSLALYIFGKFLFRFPKIMKVESGPIVVHFTTIVRVFSIWVQMSAIYETLLKLGVSNLISQTIAYGVGAFIVVSMYRWEINGSMFTDQIQWIGLKVCTAAIILLGLLSGAELQPIVWSGVGQIKWALWAGVLLLGGPFVDLQNVQRARIVYGEGRKKAYTTAFWLFLAYQALIFGMSVFNFNFIMNLLLVLAVFFLATSTMDSDVVALHEIKGKKFGVFLGLLTVAMWQFVKVIGFFNLWQIIANARIWVALIVVVMTIYLTSIDRKKGIVKKTGWAAVYDIDPKIVESAARSVESAKEYLQGSDSED